MSSEGIKRRKKNGETSAREGETQSGAPGGDVTDIRAKLAAGFSGEVTQTKGQAWKSLKQMAANENFDLLPPTVPTYASIEAPPSTIPAKKYCDLTGFSASYTDPRTRLRFCSPEAFRFIRSLPEHRVQEFLAIRQAETRLK
mmetsp:Transcript_782/g.2538  ORF Transcript_782/g.2538 Transcript_782/m.2538 type:complete len:142 (-) Transcript_782:2247-2672(-)